MGVTKIEWCSTVRGDGSTVPGFTFNPWRGCTKASDGCKHCYAETLSKRFDGRHGIWGPKGTRVIASESYWQKPIAWNEAARQEGVRRRVFCGSMCDIFEGPETMPDESWIPVSHARERVLKMIMATPHLDWLLLTKRPENITLWGPTMMEWVREAFPKNLWLGTSVEDQATADSRIRPLLEVDCAVRFLSCEPLLGRVDPEQVGPEDDKVNALTGHAWIDLVPDVSRWTRWKYSDYQTLNKIDWVIAGGESGSDARPMDPEWAMSLAEQCNDEQVPFFMKQGSQANWPNFKDFDSFPEWLRIRQFPRMGESE